LILFWGIVWSFVVFLDLFRFVWMVFTLIWMFLDLFGTFLFLNFYFSFDVFDVIVDFSGNCGFAFFLNMFLI